VAVSDRGCRAGERVRQFHRFPDAAMVVSNVRIWEVTIVSTSRNEASTVVSQTSRRNGQRGAAFGGVRKRAGRPWGEIQASGEKEETSTPQMILATVTCLVRATEVWQLFGGGDFRSGPKLPRRGCERSTGSVRRARGSRSRTSRSDTLISTCRPYPDTKWCSTASPDHEQRAVYRDLLWPVPYSVLTDQNLVRLPHPIAPSGSPGTTVSFTSRRVRDFGSA
jgi:hypothetical protein